MNNHLSKERINYILEHLEQTIDLSELRSYFVFLTDSSEILQHHNKIIFLLSNKDLDLSEISYYNDVPILFPVLKNDAPFFIFQGTNLIFNHDVLKSAFYLLSGYQELNPEYKGKFNRFAFELSIQYKLGITHKPIVNYYFEFIKSGLKEFCELNKIVFKPIHLFKTFGFFLTHDIDKVDTYSYYDLIYYIKVLLGFRKKDISFIKKVKKVIEYSYNFLFTKNNPSWDFEFLRSVEKKYNFNSTFFFLPKDVKHQDAYYSFEEPRLIELFDSLKKDNCEIGMHGTNRSATDFNHLKSNISELTKYSKYNLSGIRQHRLIFDINTTPYLHEKAGLFYDTTLGFAEHEGFRNSYCLPFKLYNFKEEKPFSHWEIPLNIMDATLFEYRKLNTQIAFESVKNIIDEIVKFNGVFTLLWHNGYFDEIIYPGIKEFYIKLLDYLSNKKATSITKDQIESILNNETKRIF